MGESTNQVHAIDVEEAGLRLAFLKENFEYRALWDEYKALRTSRSRTLLEMRTFLTRLKREFGIQTASIPLLRFQMSPKVLIGHVLDLLDPQEGRKVVPKDIREAVLPTLFSFPHIVQLVRSPDHFDKDKGDPSFEQKNTIVVRSFERLDGAVRPFERILLIDVRAKKAQLKKEFNALLDHLPLDYSRSRKESEQHLLVWKTRRKRKSFAEIARELKITEEAAKKSYYRAYEITQGRTYEPERLRRDVRLWRKSELEKTCDTCKNRERCDTPCPDILGFLDQDFVPRRELVHLSEYLALESHGLRDPRGKTGD